MTQVNTILFQDTININDMDSGGKKFGRVSRFYGCTENTECDITVDINTELYPLDIGDRVQIVLASSLALDPVTGLPTRTVRDKKDSKPGDRDEDDRQREPWRPNLPDERDLSDKYDAIYVSYGGLLMELKGSHRHVEDLHVGQHVYLLLRKTVG
ncbi:10493_t:CDS:2 [Paraglomus brasilianum]|uniref:DNA-directed RNA polymerases I, II, and III subunit RPABC3 n=1 Tax=Paraglomus brasilianum TaxID=144538 RepID=A0A9N9GIX7_9GLOM|nr:10493_t:CDS:2 [Paraglomus brasilianum]